MIVKLGFIGAKSNAMNVRAFATKKSTTKALTRLLRTGTKKTVFLFLVKEMQIKYQLAQKARGENTRLENHVSQKTALFLAEEREERIII